MVLKQSPFLTTSFNPSTHQTSNKNPNQDQQQEQEEEELNEYDVVWSSSSSSSPEKTTPKISANIPSISLTPTPGLSAALLSSTEPQSPTSIQRKTTSSPVAMISSSLTRGNGSGYYYGPKYHHSAPVNVPVWPSRFNDGRMSKNGFGFGSIDEDDGDDLLYDGKMVPPHEIVAQSYKNTMSFSVMEGAGRTLKGRDLTTVRNAVFQKTGFLE
ncbi:protein S40-4-like [Amaranthus tricolor]|uniref:protein S40-4-like n=1 Tax=Amaranthus tricolor TaxID=29722 RepID=UPI00258EC4F1|nr:protein S40-4-like [Amaranthus tricolor]